MSFEMSEQQDSSNQSDNSSQRIPYQNEDVITATASPSNEERANEADAIVEVESEYDSDSAEMEWVEETSEAMYKACSRVDWNTFEKFLTDESISKSKKKLVLEDNMLLEVPFLWGAPFSIIKHLVDIEGVDTVAPSKLGDGQSSWLHTAVTPIYGEASFEIAKLLVDIGGKELVNMQSNRPEDRKRTALQMLLSVEANDSNIVELLLKVGGVELLGIQDEDGYGTIDYCNKAESEVIVQVLKDMENNADVQKHIDHFETSGVTPGQVETWIRNREWEDLRTYLKSEEVTKEAKKKCFKFRSALVNDNLFHLFCSYLGPLDIAQCIVDLMGSEFLLSRDIHGYTCLHTTCGDDHEDDHRAQHALIEFLVDQNRRHLLYATNRHGENTLQRLMYCKRLNFDSITFMVDIGGMNLLCNKDDYGRTVLHLASFSYQDEPNKAVILYLLSKGGSVLREIKDCYGKKAEDYWSPEVKQYVDLHTKISPALSDDLQCPVCFDTMDNVHMIPQCCHRFCKKCITDAFYRNGNTCPVCRVEYSLREVRKDPLLCKFAMLVHKKEEQNQALSAELADLKRKYSEF